MNRMIFYNTNKKTWDCGICRKYFKEKKDLEQHLNSGTHDLIRFACSQCGKGFASLGSLTLHMEQTGHSNKKVQLPPDSDLMHAVAFPSSTTSNYSHSMSTSSMQLIPSNFGSNLNRTSSPRSVNLNLPLQPSLKPPHDNGQEITSGPNNRMTLHNSMSTFLPVNNSNFPSHNIPTIHTPPFHYSNLGPIQPQTFKHHVNPFQLPAYSRDRDVHLPSSRLYYLHITGHSERYSLDAGCAYVIVEGETRMKIREDAFVIHQYYVGSIQPEYEALCEGLAWSLEKGIRRIIILTTNEILFSQLNNGKGLLFFQTSYRVVNNLISKATKLLNEFDQIDVKLILKEFASYENELAKTELYSFKYGTVDNVDIHSHTASPSSLHSISFFNRQ